jgi:hypothetical protein
MTKLNKQLQKIIDENSNNLYREEIYINSRHEYNYHKLEAAEHATVHTLYYSDDTEWSVDIRNTVAMQLVDTGNGIEIIGISTKKEINYLEAEQLHILLRLSSGSTVYQIAEPTPKKDF